MPTDASDRYIVVWRRSETARQLDVQVNADQQIAVLDHPPIDARAIKDEDDLIAYINSQDTHTIAVPADLAHQVLGWAIP